MKASSCEVRGTEAVQPSASRVMRYQEGGRWEGVPATEYKAPANHWCGILRTVLGRRPASDRNEDRRRRRE